MSLSMLTAAPSLNGELDSALETARLSYGLAPDLYMKVHHARGRCASFSSGHVLLFETAMALQRWSRQRHGQLYRCR